MNVVGVDIVLGAKCGLACLKPRQWKTIVAIDAGNAQHMGADGPKLPFGVQASQGTRLACCAG